MMKDVLKMAGDLTSHAISCVASGETLIPILGILDHQGNSKMQVLMMGSAQAMAEGHKQLNNLSEEQKGVVFINDAMVSLDTGKTDSLVVDVRFANNDSIKIQFLVPYRNANDDKGFAVHKLELSQLEGLNDDMPIQEIYDPFYDGLESHPEGSKVWAEKFEKHAGESNGYKSEENTKLSTENYEKLKQAPFLIFFLVAAADGVIDNKELEEFVSVLTDPNNYLSPLLNRIITNVLTDVQNIILNMSQKETNYIEELIKIRTIVDDNLSNEEANEFKLALFTVAKKIAEASGGFLGFGSKISKEEKAALAAIVLCLEITAA